MLWTNPAGKVKVRASGPVHFNLEERERERAVAATSDSVSCVGCVDWSASGWSASVGTWKCRERPRKLVGKMTVLRGAVRRLGPTCGLTGWLAGRWLGGWEAVRLGGGRREAEAGGQEEADSP